MSDNLKPGDMRAYLKALIKTQTKSPGGVLGFAWNYAFHFYAAMTEQKATESFANLMPGYKNTVTFTTWYRDDLKRDMRVEYDGELYDIISLTTSFKTITIDCQKTEQ